MDKTQYMSGKKASELLGVHQRTLHQWDASGKIEVVRAPGGKRFYNVKKYLASQGIECREIAKETICDEITNENINQKMKISYARVSSMGQKNDLERQKQLLHKTFPNHTIIEDIGSGINLTKRGILKIIDMAIKGQIDELVIVHKDRLARFGYELIEYIIKTYSSGKIIIINQSEEIEPEEEMVKDVLQIMNVFVAKMNGRRKYNKRAKNEMDIDVNVIEI
jgi:predicted site-specific integrase-resolvase